MAIKYDLHVHSTLSDGISSREELIKSALNNNILYISFTDHNICESITASYDNITIIDGIEIDCNYGSKKIHLLAYGINNLKKLNEYLKQIKLENDYICRSAIKILEHKYGIVISDSDISKHTNDLLNKRIIAKILLDKFNTDDVDFIYKNFIGSRSQSYIVQKKLQVKEAIDLLKSLNSVVVLAHPITLLNQCSSIYEFDSTMNIFFSYGLNGIEVINPKNTIEFSKYLDENKFFDDCIKTAGTDYHGDAEGYSGINYGGEKYLIPLLKELRKI